MVSLNTTGITYRTKLMDHEAAFRFAKCLSANPRFTGAFVAESDRAKGAKKHYVSYQCASETRRAELLQDQQDARLVRAAEQAHGYEIVQEPEARFFYVLNVTSGEVYETTESTCTCPDYQYRCQPSGLACKHIEMLRHGFAPVRSW